MKRECAEDVARRWEYRGEHVRNSKKKTKERTGYGTDVVAPLMVSC